MWPQVLMPIQVVDQMRTLAENFRTNQAFVVLVLGVSTMMSSQLVQLLKNFVA